MRVWSVQTKRFIGEKGVVRKLSCVQVTCTLQDGSPGQFRIKEIPGTEFEKEADLVILSMGFVSPARQGLLEELGVKLDARGNVQTDSSYQTSIEKVFAAGDMRRGQSLIAHAASEGRKAAHYIDRFLMGRSSLPIL